MNAYKFSTPAISSLFREAGIVPEDVADLRSEASDAGDYGTICACSIVLGDRGDDDGNDDPEQAARDVIAILVAHRAAESAPVSG